MPRLDRGIQYAGPLGSTTIAPGILGRPVKPDDDIVSKREHVNAKWA